MKPTYTDEEYAEIKAKGLWGEVDLEKLAGRGTVVAMTELHLMRSLRRPSRLERRQRRRAMRHDCRFRARRWGKWTPVGLGSDGLGLWIREIQRRMR
jgi:hypothetical protein